MSIITPSIFAGGEQAIAQLSNAGVNQNVQSFIDEYEPEFLKELLGVDLYNEFVAGLAVTPVEDIDPKWIALRDEMDLKLMIKCYVYYWYMTNLTTTSAGTSEVKANNENSTPTNNDDKNVKAWNKMAKKTRLFDLSTDVYPSFVRVWWNSFDWWYPSCGISEIYYYKNTLGF